MPTVSYDNPFSWQDDNMNLSSTVTVSEYETFMATSNIRDGVLLLVCEGPVSYLSYRWQCVFIGYYAFSISNVITILPANYYYRYNCINGQKPSHLTTIILYLISLIAGFFSGYTSYLSALKSGHNRAGFNYGSMWFNYGPIPNIIPLDSKSAYTQIASMWMINGLGGAYILALYYGRLTMLTIRDNRASYSGKTLRLEQQLSTALLLQAVLPILTSVGPTVTVASAIIFGINVGAFSITAYATLAWIPLFNPLATVFAIKPYQMALLNIIKQRPSITSFSHSSSSGLH
ncbi:unnamed protein product [Bursaphelenchus okinawaensis]|uniref:G protein-coupled receptor n=1 Tax=Bursaphelenchus okinawaensis TaxID=465554 RepID=A0A811JRK2_9BILA|nr:unnamed protein product [Bursaphelenchus okinawaensis]CAG9080317.1 unnamed protein product [Bursaphelenchus okinawaensis]